MELQPVKTAALSLCSLFTHPSDMYPVSQHQDNHTRILKLRKTAETLENQAKASIRTLAQLRKELQETPATTFPETSKPVPFDELLRYARNISKHTVPPTYREKLPQDDSDTEKEVSGGIGSSNGIGTPAENAQKDQADGQGEIENVEKKYDLPEQQVEWLKKQEEQGLTWVPWPHNDRIRYGNLADIQRMLDRGLDPSTVLPPALKEEEDRQRAEEEERQKREQEQREEEERERRRRGSMMPGAQRQAAPQQPATFGGLDMYDED